MPSLPNPKLSLPKFKNLSLPTPSASVMRALGARSAGDVVGLDIQPGFVAAVKARANGSIVAERVACLPLASDTVREGEVIDGGALSAVLEELFGDRRLSKRVRVGIANQRTVMRMLELPPVTDRKELAAAVQFQAQDQVPMPLSNAVLDFHPMGVVDTPSGPRQHVVLVAAQLDMVENLLTAVRNAGLQPEGIDLAAFALMRSLYRPAPETESEQDGRVVYLNVDGLTNLVIAEGKVCRFTRVVGGGLEGMAGELAERRSMPVADARELLARVDLTVADAVIASNTSAAQEVSAPEAASDLPAPEGEAPETEDTMPQDAAPEAPAHEGFAPAPAAPEDPTPETGAPDDAVSWVAAPEDSVAEAPAPAAAASEDEGAELQPQTPLSAEDHAAEEHAMSFSEMSLSGRSPEPEGPPESEGPDDSGLAENQSDGDVEARKVLENGIREISGEVRNSLDFYRSQEGGGDVSHVVLSGSVLDVPGFAEALQSHLGLEVRTGSVELAEGTSAGGVSMNRLAVAAGLTTVEVQP
jgi:type IV pilus assembly protein PilM